MYRLLLIADVRAQRHIGDEAMLETNLAAFRRLIPNVSFAIMSSHPSWVASRYGVEGVPLFGFPRGAGAESERGELLHGLLETVRRGERTQTIDAIAAADAVVISGGGNLSTTWPDLLYERVALLEVAHLLGKAAVVLGQTLGPRVDGLERLLGEALAKARYVGVREIPSAMLAVTLGVPQARIWYQCDDALLPDEEAVPAHAPAIAVTIDPQIRATSVGLFDSLADQLRSVSVATGLPLLLIPHAYEDEHSGAPSDSVEAQQLAARLGDAVVTIMGNLDADEIRRVTASAAMVISTRFHPIVFSFSASVPALGIYGDDYCRIKLQGVFAHARLDSWTLTYADVASGELHRNALALWNQRQDVRQHLDARRAVWKEETRERWVAVLRALGLETDAEDSSSPELFGVGEKELADVLARAFQTQRQWSDAELTGIVARYMRTQKELIEELGPRRTWTRYVAALRLRMQRRGIRFGRTPA